MAANNCTAVLRIGKDTEITVSLPFSDGRLNSDSSLDTILNVILSTHYDEINNIFGTTYFDRIDSGNIASIKGNITINQLANKFESFGRQYNPIKNKIFSFIQKLKVIGKDNFEILHTDNPITLNGVPIPNINFGSEKDLIILDSNNPQKIFNTLLEYYYDLTIEPEKIQRIQKFIGETRKEFLESNLNKKSNEWLKEFDDSITNSITGGKNLTLNFLINNIYINDVIDILGKRKELNNLLKELSENVKVADTTKNRWWIENNDTYINEFGQKIHFDQARDFSSHILSQYLDIKSTKEGYSKISDNNSLAEQIYSQLGPKTKSDNIRIVQWKDLKDAEKPYLGTYENSINVISTRIKNSNEHFGNPFSDNKNVLSKNSSLIPTQSIKESVIKYIDWVLNSDNARAIWIRNIIKSEKFKNTPILYYTELNEPSHATALDYLLNHPKELSHSHYKSTSKKDVSNLRKLLLDGENSKGGKLTPKEIYEVWDEFTSIKDTILDRTHPTYITLKAMSGLDDFEVSAKINPFIAKNNRFPKIEEILDSTNSSDHLISGLSKIVDIKKEGSKFTVDNNSISLINIPELNKIYRDIEITLQPLIENETEIVIKNKATINRDLTSSDTFVNTYYKGNSETLPQPIETLNGNYIYQINDMYYASPYKLYTLDNINSLQKSKNKGLLFDKLSTNDPLFITSSIISQIKDNLKVLKSGNDITLKFNNVPNIIRFYSDFNYPEFELNKSIDTQYKILNDKIIINPTLISILPTNNISLDDILQEYPIDELKGVLNLRSLQNKIEERDFETIKKAYNYLKSEERYKNIEESNKIIDSKLKELQNSLNRIKETKIGDVLTILNNEDYSEYKVKVLDINKFNDYAILKVSTKNKEYTIRVNKDGTTKNGQIENFVFNAENIKDVDNIKKEISNLKTKIQPLKLEYIDYFNSGKELERILLTAMYQITGSNLNIEEELNKLNDLVELEVFKKGDDYVVHYGKTSHDANNIPQNNQQIITESDKLNIILDRLKDIYGVTFNTVTTEDLQTDPKFNSVENAGMVNGFILDGNIYINTDNAKSDVPLHELSHIILGSLASTDYSKYKQLVDSVEQLENYSTLLNNYTGRTRTDANEEIFVDLFAKHYTQNLELDLKDSEYELKRNIDSAIFPNISITKMDMKKIMNMSFNEIMQTFGSTINNETIDFAFNNNSSDNRMIANIKERLLKDNTLMEICG